MNEYNKILIDKLRVYNRLEREEWLYLIDNRDDSAKDYLYKISGDIREKIYGKDIYIRGLIEYTNYCKNNCYYCGIRCGNSKVDRYRLELADIMECCREGYELGFRTFVLQGGEDPYFTDERMVEIISSIRNSYPDCAITLSIGEKSRESYQKFFNAGANRFLLRHETANEEHYSKLHPDNMSLENRMRCLNDLKDIGYQVGCGFMVGSPYQTSDDIANDMVFLQDFKPHMVGIGPFISHCDTPFKDYENGTVELTVYLLALIRIMLPNVLLPATTALGTLSDKGREQGIMVGANVIMPNLSPLSVRKKYMLYDNKISTGDEAADMVEQLRRHMREIGFNVVEDRGDYKG